MANLHKHFHNEDSLFISDKTKQIFSCIFCTVKYSSKKEIREHSLVAHSIKCIECKENFLNPFFLGLHMALHDHAEYIFCPLCDYKGTFAVTLRKHITNTHFDISKSNQTNLDNVNVVNEENEEINGNNAKVANNKNKLDALKREQNALRKREQRQKTQLICKICGKKYPTLKDLRNHRKVHKAERLESLYTFNSLRKLFSCDTCLQEFRGEDQVQKHVESHSYCCPTCSAEFKKALLLGLHMAEHNDKGEISCPLCDHEFKTLCKSRLLRHIKQKHQKERPKTNQCEYCGSSYLSKQMLEDHIKVVHLQKEPYRCIVCGNTFILKSSMRIHQINKHRVVDESELSSNYCTLCKMSFKKLSSLAKHLEMKRCIPTPRVERQGHFVCDLCGKEFRFYKTFNLHQREHAGDKPYKCSYCPKAFVINSKRLAHEVSHTDTRPFSCETCGQSYKTWKHLRRHLVVHGSNVLTFTCPFCSKEFSTKDTLRAHVQMCSRKDLIPFDMN